MRRKRTYQELEQELMDLQVMKTMEYRDIEKNLLEHDQMVSLIYDTVEDIIYSLAIEGENHYVFCSVNESFLKATGLKRNEVIGQNVRNIIPEPSLSMVLEKYKEAISTKKVVRWEEVSEYPSGLKTGEVSIAPIFDEFGKCVMLVGSVHDITELRQSVRDVERKNKELEQFSYISSHDLQEPLRTVMSFVDLLNEEYQDKLDENANHYLKYITKATGRMSRLITDLLDYSRLGEHAEMLPEVCDCHQIVSNALDGLNSQITEANAIIHVGEMPEIMGHESALHSLFQNLISNAVKFKHPNRNPAISITAKKEKGSWLFAVKDNGIGIDLKFKDKIFLICQRLHLKSEYEGSGIGLAHCQKILELHKGEIWVDSEQYEGSTFYFRIPN